MDDRMKLVSNRAARQQIAQQSRTLGELGQVLDAQADAIRGLADNQRVLMTAMQAWNTKTLWQRLRWVVAGFGPDVPKAPPNDTLPQAGDAA
jgi:hypothetical protein